MSLQSTVGVAKIGTKSLRATVPEGIVAFLDLKEGEKLNWKMDFVNSKKVVFVSKSEPEPDNTKELIEQERKLRRKAKKIA